MPPVVGFLSATLLFLFAVPAAAQTFDLRDVGNKEPEPAANALDRYLYSTRFKNPVGNYMSIDEWEEMLPVISEEGSLKVARSLVQATRDESDARALSSVLAAYRAGADKELIEPPQDGPSITLGSPNAGGEREKQPAKSRIRPLPDLTLPPPIDQVDSDDGGPDASDKPKISGPETNLRLGARIVANLATFRSCSGALINYLNHLGRKDAKSLAWARMIERSMGVAAMPPDDSCRTN